MKFYIEEIAQALGVNASLNNCIVDSLMIDSRSVVNPSTTLFVALTTPNNDGHNYIAQLINIGVKNFVVNKSFDTAKFANEVNFIQVDDTLNALQEIGLLCRKQLKGTVVGITGSRGKTLVKEWLYQTLKSNGITTYRSPRSFNSQVGVPLSLWMAEPTNEITIIEAGISEVGEMERLEKMIRPDIGILTEITNEHSTGFESVNQKISEKCKLFNGAKSVICFESQLINNLPIPPNVNIIKVNAPFHSNDITVYKPIIENFFNSIGANTKEIKIPNAPVIQTRLNVIEGVNNCKIINDRFSADIQSLRIALDFMRRQVPESMSKTLIISTLGFDGTASTIDNVANEYGIKRIIKISSEAEAANLTTDDFYNEAIMLRGTDALPLDNLYSLIEAKQHETVMEVNLDAIVHNFNFFRSKVKPKTGIICMLKAHGYGAGSIEIARTLQSQGAAYLAVAVVDEGVELRQAGITMPIMVLNPRAQNYRIMFDYRLEPNVYSFEMLDEIISSAQRCGVKDYPIHIKFETGMRRLGFIEEDIPNLCKKLNETDCIKTSTIFSHLACADDSADDEYTRNQYSYFVRCCDSIDKLLLTKPKRHILNSTGIIRFPEMQCDFVRLGIGLYGIPTLFDGSENELRNVSSLSSVVISIKEWSAGTSIGYNRRQKLNRDSKIATIPIGYADGIDRHLGNGNASFLINGYMCPTVGNICMDICIVDITDANCKVGDRVEIFGDNISPIELSNKLSTIPYEILTSISPRVKRVYFRE